MKNKRVPNSGNQWRTRIFVGGGGGGGGGGTKTNSQLSNTSTQSGCASVLFCKFFAENCMKMKEFGLGGRGTNTTSLAPSLDPLVAK